MLKTVSVSFRVGYIEYFWNWRFSNFLLRYFIDNSLLETSS